MHEAARKDVERAFGVLKAKWHIMKNAARSYDLGRLRYIMYACIIMHNMVVEEKGRNICDYSPDHHRHPLYLPGTADYLHRVVDVQDSRVHEQLREDLETVIFNAAHDSDEEDVEVDDVSVDGDDVDADDDYDDVVDDFEDDE